MFHHSNNRGSFWIRHKVVDFADFIGRVDGSCHSMSFWAGIQHHDAVHSIYEEIIQYVPSGFNLFSGVLSIC